MDNINITLDNKKNIHFIGIGGISMSGLAEILIHAGKRVSGSDANETKITKHLSSIGAVIYNGHYEENITEDIDLVVYTAAISEDNPEIIKAKKCNIPCIARATLLGLIMKQYKTAIGVAGTHGKTTTTSMVADILLAAECDPTIMVGGILGSIGGNIRIGESSNFITEACEYTNSFLSFYPTIGIILNVSEDHMDFFKDIDDIRNSFRRYCELIPKDGTLIINADIPEYTYFTKELPCEIITFGSKESGADVYAENVTFDEYARGEYDLVIKGEKISHIKLSVTGMHNVTNSLSAIACALTMKLDIEDIKKGLAACVGSERRFQKKGEVNGITIIDDYAHHPDEITATLMTAKNYPHKNTWCVFQPHTYTRTKAFLKEFAKSLSLADKVVLTDIYAAREKNTIGISSKDLLEELKKLGVEAYYFESFEEIKKFLLEKCINGDLLITMGAGNVVNIANELVSD